MYRSEPCESSVPDDDRYRNSFGCYVGCRVEDAVSMWNFLVTPFIMPAVHYGL
jgi:hypothetical protein